MITVTDIEKKYNYSFPELYKRLWKDEMLNWLRGFDIPLKEKLNWADDIYPTLKDNPPLLLHTGGSDFEMLTSDKILHFKFPELWDSKKHHFIPFAKTAEGNIYAFYKNIEIEGENPIVLIWDDLNETEILAKNFEDFIFRKMLEATDDIDKEDLEADYGKNGIEAYRKDILNDLKTISPYIKDTYVKVLENTYNEEVLETLISFGFMGSTSLQKTIKEMLDFEYLDVAFEHEI